MKPSFRTAMLTYAAMALVAAVALDGKIRLAVWILAAGLAVKTCIAHYARW